MEHKYISVTVYMISAVVRDKHLVTMWAHRGINETNLSSFFRTFDTSYKATKFWLLVQQANMFYFSVSFILGQKHDFSRCNKTCLNMAVLIW